MGRMDGKVVMITGAARGQGRSHALRLAEEGADIIAVDICDHIDSVPFPMGNADDLAETVKQVENLDRRIVARTADVRDSAQLQAALSEGLAEFGHIDVLCANAGIASMGLTWEITEEQWRDVIDVNPTTVNTPMIQNDAFYQYAGGTTAEEMGAVFQALNAIPVPWVEPIDISNAVLYLASDESRYVTGLTLWVDAGLGTKVGTG